MSTLPTYSAAALGLMLFVLPTPVLLAQAQAQPEGEVAEAGGVEDAVGYAELTPDAEAGIERGLRFLASTQNPDGSWGNTYRGAETAVALMAFMVRGEFPGRGPRGEQLDRGLRFLLERGKANKGYLGDVRQGMYEHGLATLCLSEVWGESDRDEVGDALKDAVTVIFKAQNNEGGWRYSPQPTDADLSVTVMQVVALASAKEAGVLIPDEVLDKAAAYVERCQNGDGGFGYKPNGPTGDARTAAGVLSLQMVGRGDSEACRRGLRYLLQKKAANKFDSQAHYYYSHYYAMQGMYQAGDATYQHWYPGIRNALLKKQRSDGGWYDGGSGTSPAYGTSMAILILGVPYRYLPIYQR